MSTALRHGFGGLALVLGLAGGLATAPAQAVEGSPPVTADDTVRVFRGSATTIDLLANDMDPDGDQLKVCRIGKLPRELGVELLTGDGEIFLFTKPEARGTYTFVYYACDLETLVPGTVTVKVMPTPNVTVKKLSNRPGFLKVKNPADYSIRFLWGAPTAHRPDGKVRIADHSAEIVRVHRAQIVWVAVGRRWALLDSGRVRGIKLPRGDRAQPARQSVDRELRRLWQQR